jgi:hypothetical protein
MVLMPFDERSQRLSHLFYHEKTQEEGVIYVPENSPPPDSEPSGDLTLDFPALRTVRNKFLFINHPDYGIFKIEA